ncbi:aminodeoxychorismate synthase subunit I [Halospina denitrificans]|uniref:Aminodeoxychorismate synthase subunit I n=1 Tax=Halospina denitrificans TaxID=332522 RepID=A0A4R7JU35_9GAMM|nr:aminodeoxychorismate synthase component I [Halospina denitrificans]TDT41565.1 aminodeoxychorismate synthase subunit I [Halospina denitrificans]
MTQDHQTLPGSNWSALLRAFATEPGCCVFDVPESTSQPAAVQMLTATPYFRETRIAGFGHNSELSQRARRAPEASADSPDAWLPLKIGFLGYGNGEPQPGVQVAEYDWAIIREVQSGKLELVFHADCPASRRARVRERIEAARTTATSPAFFLKSGFQPAQSRDEYLHKLERIRDYIQAGDVYQVNYAQQFTATYEGDPMDAYIALHHASPSPCSVYLDTGSRQLMSLSPERFLRVHRDGSVETRPIKGTRRRGTTEAEDREMVRELTTSTKDRAENLMIVDLLRNDLGKCCEIGSVRAEPLFALESFANVHHLVSTVTGRLAPELSPLDLLLSAFPGGSITGAPKVRAMEIIRELEPVPRGAYCGSFFHWTPRNGFDSTIAIRTLECRQGTVDCKGGGGIVADSVPEEEYRESINKVRLFMDTLENLNA